MESARLNPDQRAIYLAGLSLVLAMIGCLLAAYRRWEPFDIAYFGLVLAMLPYFFSRIDVRQRILLSAIWISQVISIIGHQRFVPTETMHFLYIVSIVQLVVGVVLSIFLTRKSILSKP